MPTGTGLRGEFLFWRREHVRASAEFYYTTRASRCQDGSLHKDSNVWIPIFVQNREQEKLFKNLLTGDREPVIL